MSDTVNTMSATKLFNNYFERILSISGLLPIDLLPKNINNIEPSKYAKYPKYIPQFEALAYCIAKAINDCTDTPRKQYKTILIDLYLKDMFSLDIQEKMGYSSTTYKRHKRLALKEFTDYFNYYAVKEGVNSMIKLG